jgi:CHASE2 domain-containing sensor protein
VVRRGLLFLHSDQGPLTALGVRLAWRYLQGEGIAPQPDPRQPAYLRSLILDSRVVAFEDGVY